MGKRVALVLAGCGVFDGSEIHEASAALVHLSRGGAEVKIFAPNIEQRDVVNHLKGSPTEEKRNVLVESARLARGNIQDLAELKASEFDAVIFPDSENLNTYLWIRTKVGPELDTTWQCLDFRTSEIVGKIAGFQIDYVPCQVPQNCLSDRGNYNHFRSAETRVSQGNYDLLKITFQNIHGGFGVAKNLCSWAVDGKNCTVNEHVNSTLQAFHSSKKPIGLCCISPVLAAKVFPGCEVTVGQDKDVDGRFPDAETASAIVELGCKHICKNVNESHVDKANKIVTTCAFMCKAPLHEIFDGIGTMVQEVLKLA